MLGFLERIQNFLLTSTELWSKKVDHLGGCFLMPYEKNKSAYQDDAYFERELRNILDVRNWNRDLIGQTFYQIC